MANEQPGSSSVTRGVIFTPSGPGGSFHQDSEVGPRDQVERERMLGQFLLVVCKPSGLAHADHVTIVVGDEADELGGVGASCFLGADSCAANVLHARQVSHVEEAEGEVESAELGVNSIST